ncbi:hypothetical protein AAF712_016107, partial [Marasmius tenuissimus]
VASDSGPRRAVPFSTALDLARKAEGDNQGVYDPRSREGSLSPQQTGSSQQVLASLGSSVEEAQPQTPSIVVSPDEPKVAEPEEIKVDEQQAASTEASTPNDVQLDPPVESSPAISPSEESTADVTAPTPEQDAPAIIAEIKVTGPPPPPPTQPLSLSGDESDGSTATVQDTRVIPACDDDDDADLFVKPIKRKSPVNAVSNGGSSGDGQEKDKEKETNNSNGSAHTDRLMPSTPSKAKGDATTTATMETPEPSPSPSPSPSSTSFVSQTITMSRPESMAETSSPGHVSFAQRISPVTSRGVPIYLPGKSGSQSPTSTDGQFQSQPPPRRKESVGASTSEFGVVSVGESSSSSSRKPATVSASTASHLRASTEPYDPEKTANRKSTFSAVVHGKVRETHSRTLPASLKNAPPPGTPVKKSGASGVGEPMSPGLGELAMLMQQSALLESRLIVGDYPDESGEKEREKARLAEVAAKREAERREAEARAKREEEEEREADRLSRSTTRTSQDSDGSRMRKLSLKKVFGMGGGGKSSSSSSKHETSVPLETIPATPPHNAGSFSNSKDLSRSRSMELLSSSRPSQSSSSAAPPLPPSITLEPPPPKPTKAHSIHAGDMMSSVLHPTTAPDTSTSTSTSASTTSSGMDSSDDVPPTPPPKSPSTSGAGSKYLSSIRRFASSSSRSGAYPPRHSVSTSSDDSVTVVTPPDYSPDFTGTRTMLETRTRTRSGSRSGKRILIGDVGPGEEEDRASVVSGSGSNGGGGGGSGGMGLQWPSKSPRKGSSGGGMSRAASFAEKMFSRGRTKSSASSASSYDTDGYDGIDPPKVSTSMLSPALPDVGSRSPSLHELILSEPLPLSIPEMNEPHQPHSSHSQTTPILARPPSWISTTSSTGTGGTDSSAYSRLFDKDFFDSFPAVPETTPTTNAVNHTRVSSSSTLRHA